MTRLGQWICGLHGHDSLLHFERGRVSLLCTSCGHETPGWDVKGTLPEATAGRPVAPRSLLPLSFSEERRAS